MRQKILQLLQSAYQQIDKLDADLLLSFTLKKTREYFMIHEDGIVSDAARKKFNKLVKKRKTGWPLAYITGHKEFFGLDFLVNKHTLIPRPDTEILVEEVIKTIDNKQLTNNKLALIDVGTGTNCIPIAIIKASKHKSIKTFAIDISPSALAVAKKNAKKHKVKIKLIHGNLLKPLKHQNIKTFKQIIITANLPYLTKEQYQSEKSIQHEPKSALVAKKEGLALYEKLLHQIKLIPSPYNLVPTTYFEIDPSQSEKITALINKILPNSKIEIKKDLAGRNRVVIIT